MPGVSTEQTLVLVLNRRHQTYHVHLQAEPDRDMSEFGAGDRAAKQIQPLTLRPGFSRAYRSDVVRAGLETVNPNPNAISLVWPDPTTETPPGYVSLRDLGTGDTLEAIGMTHDLNVVESFANELFANAHKLAPVVVERAAARAAAIRSGKGLETGRTMARDEGSTYIDMGTV